MEIRFRKLFQDARDPVYETDGSAGMDLFAYLGDDLYLDPGDIARVQTAISFEIPPGFEGQVRPRSGLTLNHGVDVKLGTIDSDYRGDVAVIIHARKAYRITHGAKIAQIVFAPVVRASLVQAEALTDTKRGAGGFGSTGLR